MEQNTRLNPKSGNIVSTDIGFENQGLGKSQPDLIDTFDRIRKSNKRTKELVEMLEYIPKINEKISKIKPKNDFDFYKKYTIFLLQNYIDDENEREFILAMFGLLEGFEPQESFGKQRLKYWKTVYNQLFEESWSDSGASREIYKIEKEIIDRLAQKISEDIIKNNGALNLIEKMPEKIEIPKPRLKMPTNDARKQPENKDNQDDIDSGENYCKNIPPTEDSFGKEAAPKIALQQDDQTIEPKQPGNIESGNAMNNGDPFVSQRDINAVEHCIKGIQISSDYDELGDKLYEALCGGGNPPYCEWMATWLIKCIRERFHSQIEADILLASFALLPGYELAGSNVRDRLNEYFLNSGYLSEYAKKQHRTSTDFSDDERSQISDELRNREKKLVSGLVSYIKRIKDPCEHIKNLDEYGCLNEAGDSFKPFSQKLNFPAPVKSNKKQKNKRTGVYITVILTIVILLVIMKCVLFFNKNSGMDDSVGIPIEKQVGNDLNGRGERRITTNSISDTTEFGPFKYTHTETSTTITTHDGESTIIDAESEIQGKIPESFLD